MKMTSKEKQRISKLVNLFHMKHTTQKLIQLSNSKNEKRAAIGKKLLYSYCGRFMKFTARELTIAVMVYNRGIVKNEGRNKND